MKNRCRQHKTKWNPYLLRGMEKITFISRLLAPLFMSLSVVLSISTFVCSDCVLAGETTRINMAVGKTYTMVPAPTYKLCTEPGDATQLTDGHTMPKDESGYFWTKPGTVGWVYPKYVYVTIDLGQVEPIGGVAFNTAAGASGVTLPTAVFIQVSDDGETFRGIGELLTLDRTQNQTVVKNEYALYKISVNLATKGRYVRLVFLPDASFIFTDEIEVYRGDAAWLAEPVTTPIALPVEDQIAEVRFTHAIRQRYQRDVAGIRELIATQIEDATEREALQMRVAKIEAQLLTEPTPNPKTFRAILPFSENHASLFAIQAAVWRKSLTHASSQTTLSETASSETDSTQMVNPLATDASPDCRIMWMDDPWQPMEHIGMPEISRRYENSGPSIDLMRGEYRGTGLVLYNTTSEPMRVAFTISPPQSDSTLSARTISCIQVVLADLPWTDTRTGVPVAAALPEAARLESSDTVSRWRVTVLPGLPKQVWLTLYGVEAYSGPLNLHYEVRRDASPGENQETKPLNESQNEILVMDGEMSCQLHLWNLEQPTTKTLKTGGWDYTNGLGSYNVNEKNRDAFLKHLKSHFVNAPWCRPDALMRFSFADPNDPKSVQIETDQIEAWLRMWSDAATQYCLFFSIGEKFGPYASGTPEFEVAVSEWTRQWAAWFRTKGIEPEKISILLQDEPGLNGKDESLTNFVHWAKVIHTAEPGFRIWEDPVYVPAENTPSTLLEHSRVLCPNRVHRITNRESFDTFYANAQQRGIEVNLYSCSGPVKHLDPYAYFRLQAWDCWRTGATASFFWAMGDDGGVSSWNEYANGKPGYCPSFIDPDSDVIVTAKHFEAMREGTQDYELFCLLRAAADAAKSAAQTENRPIPAAVTVAEQLLSDGVRSVVFAEGCDQIEWDALVDRSRADEVRHQMLETLDILQNNPTK
ncbi:MAG: discoidin domain-containing protein [Thermoguttaceae bacterium]|nr:discoidin domain-containing protein [Thermoguttaceae bacterium]